MASSFDGTPGPPPCSSVYPCAWTLKSRAKFCVSWSRTVPMKLDDIELFTSTTESPIVSAAAVAAVRPAFDRSESTASRPLAGKRRLNTGARPAATGRIRNGAASPIPTNISIVTSIPSIASVEPLPPKPVLISVDDGYVDDVRTILPDLERWHMVATFFVITGRMTEPGFLNANQIRELDRAGMDVGDHTAHHVDLRLLTPSQLHIETAGSRKTLEAVLGHPVYFFAYPFGAFNDRVVQAVHDAGFTIGSLRDA